MILVTDCLNLFLHEHNSDIYIALTNNCCGAMLVSIEQLVVVEQLLAAGI